MENFIFYLLKASIAVAILTVFYGVFLKKTTFYHTNRLYLAGVICFGLILPLIDITPLMSDDSTTAPGVIDSIPAVADIAFKPTGHSYSGSTMLVFFIWSAGAAILLIRLLVQFALLIRLRKTSTLVEQHNGMKVFDTGYRVSPFTFGSSVFVHRAMFSDKEIQTVNRHEAVHVRGRHTLDIILSELACILMWFNPFVWILRKYIRQNLEFIADNSIISEDSARKDYQYLLLKTSSGVSYVPVSTFSAQHLKKRIVMINTVKTSNKQLLKFAMVIPVLLLISLMFRNNPVVAQSSTPVTIFSESGVIIKGDTGKDRPVYIVDEWLQPATFKIDYLKQQDIVSVSIWKGEEAVKKFGPAAAANGAIVVVTKLPLYVIDGVVQIKTSNAADLVSNDNIASMNVIKKETGKPKYGKHSENGIVEITTKKKP